MDEQPGPLIVVEAPSGPRGAGLRLALAAIAAGAAIGVFIGLRGPAGKAVVVERPARPDTAEEPRGPIAPPKVDPSGIVINMPRDQSLWNLREANRDEEAMIVGELAGAQPRAQREDPPAEPEPPAAPAASALDPAALMKGIMGQAAAPPAAGKKGGLGDGFAQKMSKETGRGAGGGPAGAAGAGTPALGAAAAAPEPGGAPRPALRAIGLDGGERAQEGAGDPKAGRPMNAVLRKGGTDNPGSATASPKLMERLFQIGERVHERSLRSGEAQVLTPDETQSLIREAGVQQGGKDTQPDANQ